MLWFVLNMTLGIYGEDEPVVNSIYSAMFQSLMGFPMRLSRIDLISLKFR